MAYRITYAWEKENEPKHKQQISLPLLLGIVTFAAVLCVRMLFPQSAIIIDELMHPLTDEYFAAAFHELSDHLEQGIPLGEAVMTFCMDIIANAA